MNQNILLHVLPPKEKPIVNPLPRSHPPDCGAFFLKLQDLWELFKTFSPKSSGPADIIV